MIQNTNLLAQHLNTIKTKPVSNPVTAPVSYTHLTLPTNSLV